MLLKDKVAVIYGGGGAIGGAVARAYAREGAALFLAGRTLASLEKVAADIRATGGNVTIQEVDALDENAVNTFVQSVIATTSGIDISFNLITYADVQQPLMEISLEDFLKPIENGMRSHFITIKAAAPSMIARGSGVILTFGGSGPQTLPGLGGFKIALDAIEGLRRQWALELGQYGIRVVTIKSGGIPDSISDEFPQKAEIASSIADNTLLKRAATLEDVQQVALFLASDHARSITSTEINISAGGIVD